ncbi:MAG: polysaccharide deacetylase family protein [Candidatus Omnitrophica bacterium]|nr:polysaccharide deacetylase family protein [Candidatus Omnitrophota bacterium]
MSRRKFIKISLGIFLGFVFSFIIFLRTQYVVPILMYHSITEQVQPGNRLQVSKDAFTRQMQFLKKHNYRVIPLEELGDLIKAKKKIPYKTVVITFDDGYKDNYLYAFPILKKYNLYATIFLIVDEIDRPQQDRLSWEEIRQMQDSGIITFGSHSLDHPFLTELSSLDELRRQIFDSKRILEERLGRHINAFAYPSGRFNEIIKNLVKEAGYKLAVATNPGKGFSNNDIFALKRIRISENAKNLFIFWIKVSGYYNFFREQRWK